MKRTMVSVDLDQLIDLDVFPMNTVFSNRDFDPKADMDKWNPPFYRLADLAQDQATDSEMLATPVDMKFNEYSADEIDIRETGKMGELTAYVNSKTAYVDSVDDPDQVTFIGVGRRAYNKVQKALDESMIEPQGSGSTLSPK